MVRMHSLLARNSEPIPLVHDRGRGQGRDWIGVFGSSEGLVWIASLGSRVDNDGSIELEGLRSV